MSLPGQVPMSVSARPAMTSWSSSRRTTNSSSSVRIVVDILSLTGVTVWTRGTVLPGLPVPATRIDGSLRCIPSSDVTCSSAWVPPVKIAVARAAA